MGVGTQPRPTSSGCAVVLLVGGALVVAGCAPPAHAPSPTAPEIALRPVRILLASNAPHIRIRSPRGITFRDEASVVVATHWGDSWVVIQQSVDGEIQLRGESGEPMHLASPLFVEPDPADDLLVSLQEETDPPCYPGSLRIDATHRGGVRVINQVDVERYVACVVANEVWPTFEREAFRGQAIVARTYVLHEMMRRQAADHDVSATQRSQVYRGVREDRVGRRATQATRDTRGVVCTWFDGERDAIFCSYYSAACGGQSQPARIFGQASDVAPLCGGVSCTYCQIAPRKTYRWGPVRIPSADVLARLVARDTKVPRLGTISSILSIETTDGGRPVWLEIKGSTGSTYEILAERFRLALGGMRIRSTDCAIQIIGSEVVFSRGRGFGHGLGLCQWGMQGQAVMGRQAGEILRYYYPGSTLKRAY